MIGCEGFFWPCNANTADAELHCIKRHLFPKVPSDYASNFDYPISKGNKANMQEEIRWIKTHCARMDHGGCALVVGVKNNRIVKIKGDPDGYLNKGYVCAKGTLSHDRLRHPDRLQYPLRRIGDRGENKWQRISWSDAIEEICENLHKIKDTYGAKGVAFCQGMPKGLELFVLNRLANTFGSPNVVGVQDVCHAPREITATHTCGFYLLRIFITRARRWCSGGAISPVPMKKV